MSRNWIDLFVKRNLKEKFRAALVAMAIVCRLLEIITYEGKLLIFGLV